jgi:hypothetical protein
MTKPKRQTKRELKSHAPKDKTGKAAKEKAARAEARADSNGDGFAPVEVDEGRLLTDVVVDEDLLPAIGAGAVSTTNQMATWMFLSLSSMVFSPDGPPSKEEVDAVLDDNGVHPADPTAELMHRLRVELETGRAATAEINKLKAEINKLTDLNACAAHDTADLLEQVGRVLARPLPLEVEDLKARVRKFTGLNPASKKLLLDRINKVLERIAELEAKLAHRNRSGGVKPTKTDEELMKGVVHESIFAVLMTMPRDVAECPLRPTIQLADDTITDSIIECMLCLLPEMADLVMNELSKAMTTTEGQDALRKAQDTQPPALAKLHVYRTFFSKTVPTLMSAMVNALKSAEGVIKMPAVAKEREVLQTNHCIEPLTRSSFSEPESYFPTMVRFRALVEAHGTGLAAIIAACRTWVKDIDGVRTNEAVVDGLVEKAKAAKAAKAAARAAKAAAKVAKDTAKEGGSKAFPMNVDESGAASMDAEEPGA